MLLQLLKDMGVSSRRVTSREWAGPCPACGGVAPKSDRFRIFIDQDRYWCRQCGLEGDAIQFLRDFKNLSFSEACAQLGIEAKRCLPHGQRPGSNPSETSSPRPLEKVTTPPPPALWQQKARAFVDYCHQQLLANPAQLAWLADRGLPVAAVHLYQLGFNPGEKGKGCLYRPRASWGLPQLLKDNGSHSAVSGSAPHATEKSANSESSTNASRGSRPRLLWIPRGLVIPVMQDSHVIRLRIRRPDDDLNEKTARYYVVPGSNMAALHLPPSNPDKPHAYSVVESELDAMMLHYQFQHPTSRVSGSVSHVTESVAVGPAPSSTGLGVVAIQTAQVARLEAPVFEALSKAAVILQSGDFDQAGRNGVPRWATTFPQCKRWPAVKGKDPGDDFKAGVNLRSWVLAGLPPALTLPPKPKAKSETERHVDETLASAREWLMPRLAELLSKGWTRANLFARADCTRCPMSEFELDNCPDPPENRKPGSRCWPIGGWGIAFHTLWLQPDVTRELLEDGSIRFTWFDERCRVNNHMRTTTLTPGEYL